MWCVGCVWSYALYSFIGHSSIDFNFLFLNLAETGGILIGLVVGVTQFIFMYHTQKNVNKKTISKLQSTKFILIFSVIAGVISSFFYAAVGVYWFFNNLLSLLQEVLIINTIRSSESRQT